MKVLILIIMFFGVSAWANYFPVGKPGANTVWTDKSKCEQVEAQKCFEITGKNLETHALVDQDDLEKPIYRDVQDSPVQIGCADQDDCNAKMDGACDVDPGSTTAISEDDSLLALLGIADPMFIYCDKIISYEQKKVLREDSALKATYDSNQAIKVAEQAKINNAKKDIQFGSEVILELIALIKAKNLAKGKRKKAISDWGVIVNLLKMGSIDNAKDEITLIVPDNEVITSQEKDAILQKITDEGY